MQLKFKSLILLLAAIISVIGKSLEKLQPSQAQIQNGSKDSTFNIKLRQHSGENGQPFLSKSFWNWDFPPFEFSIFPFFGPLVKTPTTSALTKITQKPKEEEPISTTNRNGQPIPRETTTQATDNPTDESETAQSNTNSDSVVTDDMDEVVTSPTEETNTDPIDDDNFSDNDASTGPDTEESDAEEEEEMNTGDIIEGDN